MNEEELKNNVNTEEVKEEIETKENTTIETQEAEINTNNTEETQEMEKKIISNEKNGNNSASIDNSSVFPESVLRYYNEDVLLTDSPEKKHVDDYFKSATNNDEEIENLLYEAMGSAFAETAKLSKSFIFLGNGRNGKSKIFRPIEKVLGDKCSHEHLEALSGSKAGSKTTIQKLYDVTVNIAEDQKQPKYINNSMLTRVISGEPILEKGMDKPVKPHATLLFSMNEVVNFRETSLAITDRFVVIPFTVTFTDEKGNRNINIEDELCEDKALQVIVTRAVQAFEKVLDTGKFTIPEKVKKATDDYFMECNTVAEFCTLVPIKTFIHKSRYYEEYKKWCNINNREAVGNTKFGSEVLGLGYRTERYTFKKARYTYYAAPDFNNDDSRIIYDEYLNAVGMAEDTDKAFDDNYIKKHYNDTFSDYLCKYLYYQLDNDNGAYAKEFMKSRDTSNDNKSNS